jgi:hypothetical protein
VSGAPRSWAASTGFVMIHYDLLDALGGSYAAAALWERIRYRSERDGWWEATRQQMCEETRLGTGALRTALEALREAGLIESEKAAPFMPTLRWRVVWADETAGQTVSANSAATPREGEGLSADSAIALSANSATSLSTENEREELPPSTPPVDAPGGEQAELLLLSVVDPDEPSGLDAEFDGFWKAYPRHVGKGAALKAYRSARKRASLDVIAAGLRAQVPVLRRRDKGFIPHPATWLNQDRWEDDPADLEPGREQTRNPWLRDLENDAAAGLLDHYRNDPRSIG